MKKLWNKFKYYCIGIVVIALLLLAIMLKNDKIEELISKLKLGQLKVDEDKLNDKINEAVLKGEIEKAKVDGMSLEDRASWYSERYK